MPIIVPGITGPAPIPPSFQKLAWGTSQRMSIQFGGQAVPIGNNFGGVLPYVDLNDSVSFFAQGLHVPDAHTLQTARLSYRGRAILLASDHEPIIVGVPFVFEEKVTTLAAMRAQMMTAGLQWLTFDGGVTGIMCDCQSFGKTEVARNAIDPPLAWAGEMAFLCREPLFRTIGFNTSATTNVPASAGGTTTAVNITYNGSFFAEPLYTFAMPLVGGTPLVTFVFANSSAGMTLTFSVPADGNSYVVDCQLLQVYRSGNAAIQTQHTGSFPFLYPPPGQVNQLSITATCASSCTPTFSASYQNRWTT